MKDVQAVKVPELRAQMIEWLDKPGSMGAANMLAFLFGDVPDDGPLSEPGGVDARIGAAMAKRAKASLQVGELFHITKAKMPEVIEAAREIPMDMKVQRHWFHVDHGFMAFEKGYTTKAYYEENNAPSIGFGVNSQDNVIGTRNQTQIYGISWSIYGNSIRVMAWTDAQQFLRLATTEHFQGYIKERGYEDKQAVLRQVAQKVATISPLIVAGQYIVKMDQYLDHAKAEHRTALRILLSACLMLKQYTTAASIIHAPRSSHSFINRIDPHLGKKVTVIDKREIKANAGNFEIESDAPKRQLSVQFERRGHWREYKHEKWSEELREHPIWIPSHWVGHEGLPLSSTTKVTRLKR